MATATVTQTATLTLRTAMDADSDAHASPTSPARIVRFDAECVLIPDLPTAPGRLPLVLTKSYSLPLWKKAPAKNPSPVAPIDEEGGAEDSRARSPSPEDSRVVIKVPIPLFRRRASPSPSRHPRSLSTSPVVPKTLPSCLVHRSPPTGLPSSSSSSTSVSTSTSTSLPITPSASTPLPLSPVRRVSLPTSSPSSSKRRDDQPPILTVPLRACCAACEAATDTALAEGEQWKEHFTRGARRRRSASLESYQSFSSSPPHASLLNRAFSPPPPSAAVDIPRTFAGLSSALDDEIRPHAGLHMTRGSAATVTAFALRVDEVDQRRRPFSFSNEEGHYAALRAAGVEVGAGDAANSEASSSSSSGASTSGASKAASKAASGQKPPLYQAARRASAPRDSTAASSSSPPSSYLSSSPSSYTSPYASPTTYPNAQDALLVVPDGYRLRASPIAEEESEDGGSRRSSVSVSVGSTRGVSGTPPLVITPTVSTVDRARRSAGVSRARDDDEDDEAQLFPLPRRSPSSSPSPRASPVPSVRRSPSAGYSPSASVNSLVVPGGVERKSSGASTTRGRLSPLAIAKAKEENGKEKERREKQLEDGKDVAEEDEVEVLGASLSRRVSGDAGVRVDAAALITHTADKDANAGAIGTASHASSGGAERRPRSPKGPMSPKGPRPSLAAARRDKDRDASDEKVASSASPSPPSTSASTLTLTSTSTPTPAPAPAPTAAAEDGKTTGVPALPAGAALPVDVHAHHHHFHLPSLPHPHHHRARSASAASAALSDSSSSTTTNTAHAHTLSSGSASGPQMAGSPPSSPTPGKRKPSFTFAAPLVRAGGVLRGAGADVLRGVSAMGSGMGTSV